MKKWLKKFWKKVTGDRTEEEEIVDIFSKIIEDMHSSANFIPIDVDELDKDEAIRQLREIRDQIKILKDAEKLVQERLQELVDGYKQELKQLEEED